MPLSSKTKMKKARGLKHFCRTLDGLQGSIALFPQGLSEFLFSAGYPHYFEELEAVRGALEDIGLYEAVREAITRSEVLTKEGQYRQAEMLVLEVNRQLSDASGANDDMRRTYKAANDN